MRNRTWHDQGPCLAVVIQGPDLSRPFRVLCLTSVASGGRRVPHLRWSRSMGIGDHVGPWSVRREAEVAAAGGDELHSGGVHPELQSAGLPEPAGLCRSARAGASRRAGRASAAPSASVKRNWAPGCGRSLRTISRSGRPVRQSPASSATQPPSRISPSGSTAGVQAEAGTFKTA
jgi:hypothetical protein